MASASVLEVADFQIAARVAGGDGSIQLRRWVPTLAPVAETAPFGDVLTYDSIAYLDLSGWHNPNHAYVCEFDVSTVDVTLTSSGLAARDFVLLTIGSFESGLGGGALVVGVPAGARTVRLGVVRDTGVSWALPMAANPAAADVIARQWSVGVIRSLTVVYAPVARDDSRVLLYVGGELVSNAAGFSVGEPRPLLPRVFFGTSAWTTSAGWDGKFDVCRLRPHRFVFKTGVSALPSGADPLSSVSARLPSGIDAHVVTANTAVDVNMERLSMIQDAVGSVRIAASANGTDNPFATDSSGGVSLSSLTDNQSYRTTNGFVTVPDRGYVWYRVTAGTYVSTGLLKTAAGVVVRTYHSKPTAATVRVGETFVGTNALSFSMDSVADASYFAVSGTGAGGTWSVSNVQLVSEFGTVVAAGGGFAIPAFAVDSVHGSVAPGAAADIFEGLASTARYVSARFYLTNPLGILSDQIQVSIDASTLDIEGPVVASSLSLTATAWDVAVTMRLYDRGSASGFAGAVLITKSSVPPANLGTFTSATAGVWGITGGTAKTAETADEFTHVFTTDFTGSLIENGTTYYVHYTLYDTEGNRRQSDGSARSVTTEVPSPVLSSNTGAIVLDGASDFMVRDAVDALTTPTHSSSVWFKVDALPSPGTDHVLLDVVDGAGTRRCVSLGPSTLMLSHDTGSVSTAAHGLVNRLGQWNHLGVAWQSIPAVSADASFLNVGRGVRVTDSKLVTPATWNDLVLTSSSMNLTEYTCSFWYKALSPTVMYVCDARYMFVQWDVYGFLIQETDTDLVLQVRYPYAQINVTDGKSNGAWKHVVVASNGTMTSLYVDGQFKGEIPSSIGTLRHLTFNSYAKHEYQNGGWTSDAVFDDVAVYNRALTSVEVNQLFAGVNPANIVDAQHVWTFNDDTGNPSVGSLAMTVNAGTYGTYEPKGSTLAFAVADVYMNGTLLSEHTDLPSGGPTTFVAPVRISIGRSALSTTKYFAGTLDEIAVWSSKLTGSAMAAVYNAGQPTNLLAPNGAYTSANSLIAWWRFEDAAKVQDSARAGAYALAAHDSTASNAPPRTLIQSVDWKVLGGSGGVFRMDGSTKTARADMTGWAPSSTVSVSAWIKLLGVDRVHTIFHPFAVGSAGNHVLRVSSSNRLEVSNASPSVTVQGATVLQRNVWYHVGYSWSSSNQVTVYVNGVADATVTASGASVQYTGTVSMDIGEGPARDGTGRMYGVVDDLAVFGACLDPADFAALANGEMVATAPQGRWNFDTLPGADSSGNGRVLTFEGGAANIRTVEVRPIVGIAERLGAVVVMAPALYVREVRFARASYGAPNPFLTDSSAGSASVATVLQGATNGDALWYRLSVSTVSSVSVTEDYMWTDAVRIGSVHVRVYATAPSALTVLAGVEDLTETSLSVRLTSVSDASLEALVGSSSVTGYEIVSVSLTSATGVVVVGDPTGFGYVSTNAGSSSRYAVITGLAAGTTYTTATVTVLSPIGGVSATLSVNINVSTTAPVLSSTQMTNARTLDLGVSNLQSKYGTVSNVAIWGADTSFTFSTWIKIDPSTEDTAVIMRYATDITWTAVIAMRLRTTGDSRYYIHALSRASTGNNDINLTGVPLVPNRWYHIAWTWDAARNMVIYVNGAANSFVAAVNKPSISASTNMFRIGWGDSDASLSGKMDEVSIFDKVLTASEIDVLYNAGVPMNLRNNSGAYTSSSSLKHWWRFEILNTTSAGNSVSGAPSLTLLGTPSFSTDCPGVFSNAKSLLLNGTQYMTQTISYVGVPWSFSAWVKAATMPASGLNMFILDGRIASNAIGGAWLHFIGPSSLSAFGNTIDTNTVFADLAWHHVCMVSNGSTQAVVYIDGEFKVSLTSFGGSGPNLRGITLGARYISSSGSTPLNGRMDEVSIWGTALTAVQVGEIWNGALPGNLATHSMNANLRAWWRLDDNLTDSSSSNSPLTVGEGTINTSNYSTDRLDGGAAPRSVLFNPLDQNTQNSVLPYNNYAKISTTSFGTMLATADSNHSITIGYWFKHRPEYTNEVIPWMYGSDVTSSTKRRMMFCPYNNSQSTMVSAGAAGEYKIFPTTFRPGEWNHIVYQKIDATNVHLFVNGYKVVTATTTVNFNMTAVDTPTQFVIGRRNNWSNDGYVYSHFLADEFSIFNVRLTDAEVAQLYNNGVPGDLSSHPRFANCQAWWRFDGLSTLSNATTVADRSGKGNVLTLYGSTATTMPRGKQDVPTKSLREYVLVSGNNKSGGNYGTNPLPAFGQNVTVSSVENTTGQPAGWRMFDGAKLWSVWGSTNGIQGWLSSSNPNPNENLVLTLGRTFHNVCMIMVMPYNENITERAADRYLIQYSTNGGSTWIDVPNQSPSASTKLNGYTNSEDITEIFFTFDPVSCNAIKVTVYPTGSTNPRLGIHELEVYQTRTLPVTNGSEGVSFNGSQRLTCDPWRVIGTGNYLPSDVACTISMWIKAPTALADGSYGLMEFGKKLPKGSDYAYRGLSMFIQSGTVYLGMHSYDGDVYYKTNQTISAFGGSWKHLTVKIPNPPAQYNTSVFWLNGSLMQFHSASAWNFTSEAAADYLILGSAYYRGSTNNLPSNMKMKNVAVWRSDVTSDMTKFYHGGSLANGPADLATTFAAAPPLVWYKMESDVVNYGSSGADNYQLYVQ